MTDDRGAPDEQLICGCGTNPAHPGFGCSAECMEPEPDCRDDPSAQPDTADRLRGPVDAEADRLPAMAGEDRP